MSFEIARILHRARRLRLVQGLRRIRKPFALWPIVLAFTRPFRSLAAPKRGKDLILNRLERPLPLWSILLVLLLGIASGFGASAAVSQVVAPGQSKTPDFTLGANPASLSVSRGSLASFTLSLTSLNSFAGSVNLNVSLSSNAPNLTTGLNPNSVSLLTGSGTSILTVSTVATTPLGTYTLTIGGASGKLYHTVAIFLTVTNPPLPEFSITATPSPLVISAGNSGSFTITLTSIGGFTGTVNLYATITPGGGNSPSLFLNPNSVTLLSGGTANAVLTASTTGGTPLQGYSIVVQGISGSISNTFSVTLTVQ